MGNKSSKKENKVQEPPKTPQTTSSKEFREIAQHIETWVEATWQWMKSDRTHTQENTTVSNTSREKPTEVPQPLKTSDFTSYKYPQEPIRTSLRINHHFSVDTENRNFLQTKKTWNYEHLRNSQELPEKNLLKSRNPSSFDSNKENRSFREITREQLRQRRDRDQFSRSLQGPEKPQPNPQLCDFYYSEIVTYVELQPYDPEYKSVMRMISNKMNFKVDSIEKIENPFLEKAFELKKEQKESHYDYVEEGLLFHGTKQENVDDICTMNFNWRLCQSHKYGKGVSFSPNSTYASVYSDADVYNKVMIVANVLIADSCHGDPSMELPPEGYDTTHKDDGIVIVKFEDNEFCPVYKINYHLVNERVGKKGGRATRGGSRRYR